MKKGSDPFFPKIQALDDQIDKKKLDLSDLEARLEEVNNILNPTQKHGTFSQEEESIV